jgi:PhzF family phenazine biosynthesis protein
MMCGRCIMTDNLEFKLVDAFAPSSYSGNVAGVIMRADGLTDRQMQLIAREFNASETVFMLEPTTREAGIRFRWFTPACEVDFCGHATLAGVHALLEAGRFAHALKEPGTLLPIQTRAGILTVRIELHAETPAAYTIWLDMPHCQPKRGSVIVPQIAKHLGLDPAGIDPRIVPIRTEDDDVILGVRELTTLLGLEPPMSELARYCRGERIRGVLVTTTNALSAATVVQSRFFAPAAGVDEDPVTGSVHGPLGLHLVNCGIMRLVDGKVEMWCAQARGGGRAGIVRVVVTESAGGVRQVRIGGQCVTTAEGKLPSLPSSE